MVLHDAQRVGAVTAAPASPGAENGREKPRVRPGDLGNPEWTGQAPIPRNKELNMMRSTVCTVCNDSFDSRNALFRHIDQSHRALQQVKAAQARAELGVDRLVAGARNTLRGIREAIESRQLELKVAKQLEAHRHHAMAEEEDTDTGAQAVLRGISERIRDQDLELRVTRQLAQFGRSANHQPNPTHQAGGARDEQKSQEPPTRASEGGTFGEVTIEEEPDETECATQENPPRAASATSFGQVTIEEEPEEDLRDVHIRDLPPVHDIVKEELDWDMALYMLKAGNKEATGNKGAAAEQRAPTAEKPELDRADTRRVNSFFHLSDEQKEGDEQNPPKGRHSVATVTTRWLTGKGVYDDAVTLSDSGCNNTAIRESLANKAMAAHNKRMIPSYGP